GFSRARFRPAASRAPGRAPAASVCGGRLIGRWPGLSACSPVFAAKPRLIRAPIRRDAGGVVDLDFPAAGAPIEILTGGERRRGLELLVGETELVGAERAVVSEPSPGDGKMLLPQPEKPAEAEHGVSDVPTELIDHEALDGADLLAIGAPHR